MGTFSLFVGGPMLHAALELFMSSPWIYWGIGPTVSAFLGFFCVAVFCEWAIRQPWCRPYLIVYSDDGQRAADVAKTQAKVSWGEQVRLSLWTVGGPLNLLGAAVVRYVFPVFIPEPTTLLPSLGAFLAQFFLLALLADPGLYWGHRIQHESEYLWKHCHSVHHTLRTPTSFSTAYIEGRDAALQSVVPLFLAGVLVRPHPVTYSLYLAFHVGNNAWNHSGIDGPWINAPSLKFLPLRCANTLHDAHHRFSGFKTGKNYGEMFWLWDWVFGTLTKTESLCRHEKVK